MQADCAVFRTERTLAEGETKIDAVYKKMEGIEIKDRSLLSRRPRRDARRR